MIFTSRTEAEAHLRALGYRYFRRIAGSEVWIHDRERDIYLRRISKTMWRVGL